MPALNKAYESFERPGLVVSYRLSNVRVFKGALVGVNASGFLVPMAHGTSGLRFVGVANETVDNSTGSAGARSVNVTKSGSFVCVPIVGVSPTVADLGKVVYANTDWEFQIATAGLTNQYAIGTVVGFETSSTGQNGARIRIDNHTV